MLELVQNFIVVFIEINTLLILWSYLQFREENDIKKNMFICIVGSIITISSDALKLPYIVIFSYLSTICLVYYFYKKSFSKVILNFVVFAIISGLLEVMVMKIFILIGINYRDSFIYNCAIALITMLLISIVCHCFLSNHISDFLRLNTKIAYCFIINLGAYLIVIKLTWEYSKHLLLNNIVFFIIASITMFVLNMILYSYVVKILEEKEKLEIRKSIEPILVDMIEEVRCKQHEYKNYLSTIYGIIEVADEKELKFQLKEYIKNLKVSVQNSDNIVYIDNIIIRATVYNKLCEAERLNIKFEYNITENLIHRILRGYEISEILNNLINNAFEAVLNEANREVILNIYTENNHNLLEVKNSGINTEPIAVNSIFNRGFSTKGEKRGYGLYNIKRLVERANGKIELEYSNNYTIIRILFKQTFRGNRFTNEEKTS